MIFCIPTEIDKSYDFWNPTYSHITLISNVQSYHFDLQLCIQKQAIFLLQ